MRQRGRDSWELRVYLGRSPDTGKERWATRTVHGSQRHARPQLQLLADEVLATGPMPARLRTCSSGGWTRRRRDGQPPRSGKPAA